MTTKQTCAITLVALLCGGAAGYLLGPLPQTPVKASESPRVRAKQTDALANATIASLNRRIRSLEKELAARAASTKASTNDLSVTEAALPKPPPERAERRGPPSVAEIRAHLEEIKKNNPEQYTQMTNRFATWRANRLARTESRLATLASVDTSRMTQKEKATHERLQDLLARQEELREMTTSDNMDITDQQRQDAFKEMREIHREMGDLETAERDTLLGQTVTTLGYKGDDAAEIVETIKAIYSATGSDRRGGFGRGPGGPR